VSHGEAELLATAYAFAARQIKYKKPTLPLAVVFGDVVSVGRRVGNGESS
jgi:hypothetical protein